LKLRALTKGAAHTRSFSINISTKLTMVEAAQASDEEVQDQSFLEVPAILDKFKAAAQIADGKQSR
jgi:hypothetical protein